MIKPPSTHRIQATTLGDLLLTSSDQAGDAPLLIFPDEKVTYGQMVERAYAHARRLRALGVGPGDSVGILMANCPVYLEILFGASMLGAMVVPLNARYKAPELAYVIENADLEVLITSDLIADYADFGALLSAALPELESADAVRLNLSTAPRLNQIVMLGEREQPGCRSPAAYQALEEKIEQAEVDALRVAVRLEQPAIMMYTSGTTANPKGCPLSHGLLTRNGINMHQERYFLKPDDVFWAHCRCFICRRFCR